MKTFSHEYMLQCDYIIYDYACEDEINAYIYLLHNHNALVHESKKYAIYIPLTQTVVPSNYTALV